MKKKFLISVACTVLLICFSFSAFSLSFNNVGVSFNSPEGYTEITADNLSKNGEIIKELGYTVSTISKYFNDNGILFIAVENEGDGQIQLKCTETDFTLQTDDITELDDELVINIAQKILDIDKNKLKPVLINGVKFFETRSVAETQEGKYSVVQYSTIRNGKLYTFSYYNGLGSVTNAVIEEGWNIAKELKISKLNSTIGEEIDNTLTIVIISAAVIIACSVIVYIFVTFFLDIKNKSESKGNGGIIKRRNK